MEIKDYIYVKENGISPDLCDDILKESVSTYEWKAGTVGENNVEEEIRKCDSIFISKDSVIELNEDIRKDLDDRIFQSVSECMGEYLNKYTDFLYQVSKLLNIDKKDLKKNILKTIDLEKHISKL